MKSILCLVFVILLTSCGSAPAPWIVRGKYIDSPESYKAFHINPKTKEPETWCYTDGKDYVLKARCLYGPSSFKRIYVSKNRFDKVNVGDIYTPQTGDEYVDFKKIEIKDLKGKVIFKNDKFE